VRGEGDVDDIRTQLNNKAEELEAELETYK